MSRRRVDPQPESEKVKSSHAIGKQGEAEVLALLTGPVLDEFPYSEIKDVSHISHSADFHLWIMSRTGKRVKLLLDSKKYSTCVSSSHITKLYSDVDADVEAQGGILLSLSSSICKKKQFEISTTPRQKHPMGWRDMSRQTVVGRHARF